MSLDLRGHLALVLDECAGSEEAPHSLRRAWLAVRLMDMLAERAFDTWRLAAPNQVRGAEDVIAYRDLLSAASPAYAAIAALAAGLDGSPVLAREMVPIADLDAGRLLFADWMITAYNQHEVPTVVIAWPDGRRRQLHPVLAEAAAFWRNEFETRDL